MRTPFRDSPRTVAVDAARRPRFRTAGPAIVVALAGALTSCSSAGPLDESVESSADSLAREDGLAEAYGVFKALFTDPNLARDSAREQANVQQDQHYTIGFGYHPGLSTTKIVLNGKPVRGQ